MCVCRPVILWPLSTASSRTHGFVVAAPVADCDAEHDCLSNLPNTADLLTSYLAPYHKSLKSCHINAQSLLCHIDEVRAIFDHSNVDLIGVSETWLKPNLDSFEVEIPGYILIRNDRVNKTGGGVALYIRDGLKANVLLTSPPDYSAKPEYLFVEITSISKEKLLLGICYRPPRTGLLTEFENALLHLMPNYTHVLVMGDFNINLLMTKPNYEYRHLTTMFESCSMTILPLDATHHTADSHTLLDLLVVSDPSEVICHGQLPIPGISSHDLVFCVIPIKQFRQKANFITYRDFRNIDENLFFTDLARIPWQIITGLPTVDEMLSQLNYWILDLYNKHAPLTTKRISKKRSTPWLTNEIRSQMGKRDAIYRRAKRLRDPELMLQYRLLRNKVKQDLRNAKLRYIHNLFPDRGISSAAMWRNIKSLGCGKQKTTLPVNIPLNDLNEFFISSSIPNDQDIVKSYIEELSNQPNPPLPFERFSFKHVLEIDTLRAFRKVTSNATGVDGISIKMIKKILFAVLPVITAIFNKSLATNNFPSLWKYALVLPLNKVPVPSEAKHYRPISILPTISKCLEKIVHLQINTFLNNNNILNTYQSGFRSSHSTETALLCVTDDIRRAMDLRKCTVLTLFDFSKAFDCVDHSLLLVKLQNLGFSESSLCWIRSYLTGRQQCVRVDDRTSTFKSVSSGVPQGSILGPLLFSLYINDISSVLSFTKHHMYADDLQIYAHSCVSTLNETITRINLDIENLVKWTKNHGLKLNEDKTQPIIICSSRLHTKFNIYNIKQILVNGNPLPFCTSVKNLGVIFNQNMTWEEEVLSVCKKASGSIHSLKQLQYFLPVKIKLRLVKALVFPHFIYCNSVYNDMTVALANKLQVCQNYCIRFVFNLKYDDHISQYYIQNSILKLADLRLLKILSILFLVLNDGNPKYLAQNFQYNSKIGAKETRSASSILRIPLHRTSFYTNSFSVTACREWNKLSPNLKRCDSRARFTASLKAFLFERMSL